MKIVICEGFLPITEAKVGFGGCPGDTGDDAARQTEGKHEAVEQLPDFPLATVVVPEDRMADHQVTEDGDSKRTDAVPGKKDHADELEASAELRVPKPVPG